MDVQQITLSGKETAGPQQVVLLSLGDVSGREAVFPVTGRVDSSAVFMPYILQVQLHRLHVPGWKLLRPLEVSILLEKDEWIVSDDLFNVYGTGDDLTEARLDYESTLVRFYRDIVEWEGGLAQHLEDQRALLEAYLRREGD
ncbi:MAG: hypothetical protein MUP04_08970 [Anaerolineae bacterium]|jgi:hypothetical protein|nr:hypothetical protein [Anaerolineae bacterium]